VCVFKNKNHVISFPVFSVFNAKVQLR